MNATQTTKLPYGLRKTLDRYRRRQRLVSVQRGLFLALGVFVGCVGAAVALDRWLRLPTAARAVCLILTAGAFLVLMVVRVVRPALRKMSDRRAATRLGRRFPEMREDLLSAVELSAVPSGEQGVSRSLILSVIRHIAVRARKIDYRAAVPLRPLLKVAAALVVVALLFQAAYLSRPEAIRNALRRLFLPNKSVAFFSYTKLDVQPGDHVIRTGDTVDVLITTSRRLAKVARLEGRSGSISIRRKLACEQGRATWQSAPLFEDLIYRARAGDALSEWYRVRVAPPPALREKSAVLRDPDYAGGGERVVESINGPLVVVEGTTVVLRMTPTDRGADEAFRCKGDLIRLPSRAARTGPAAAGSANDPANARLPLARDEHDRLCSAPFVPARSSEYQVDLVDGYGLRSRTPERIFIKVVPDALPKVKIKVPGRDLVLLRSETVGVEMVAEDEFGLRELVLTYRIVNDKGRAASVRWLRRHIAEGGVDARRLDGKSELNVAALGLDPGDALEYRAEASDYADIPEMRPGCSRLYRITVISETEHLRRVLSRLKDIRIQLLKKAAKQLDEAAKVGETAEKAGEAPVNKEARDAQDRQADLARGAENIARDVESLMPELIRNPSVSAELISEMAKLAQAIRSVAKDPMTSAADKLGEAARTKAGDPGRAGKQSGLMKQAQQSGREAAKELRRLARRAAQLQRSGLLQDLAARAELLAARQREVKDSAARTGIKTLGTYPEDLPDELKAAVIRLAAAQDEIASGVEGLSEGIKEAAAKLLYDNPGQAETADQAGEKLREDKVFEKASELVESMKKNILFSKLAKQEEVATSLDEVAKMLRSATGAELPDAIARELEEFIKRQTAVNTGIESAIREDSMAPAPPALTQEQMDLEGDVREQANALYWLARELRSFSMQTPVKLEAAAGEMKFCARRLDRSALPKGLEHGKKALELLKDAREKFEEERDQMGQCRNSSASLQAVLLLQRIILEQRQLIRRTAGVDRMLRGDLETFARRAVHLARRQSALRVATARLKKMLEQIPPAADLVERAGGKMQICRLALERGDTGKETRTVQRQAAALLEKLLGDQKNRMCGMGLAGARAMALMQLMQMMAQPGASPGGFAGGGNAPILPAVLNEAGDQSWRIVRSRFEGNLGANFEPMYPPGFRHLLEFYFDGLRNEPVR